MRDSTVFYRSFYDATKDLPKEVQADIYTAMFEYAFYLNEVPLEGTAKAIFTLIKPQLDANIRKWKNGKNGGRPSEDKNQEETKKEPTENQEETKPKRNANANANANASSNKNVDADENKEIDLRANGSYFLNKNEVIKKAFMQDFKIKDENRLVNLMKEFHLHCEKYNKLKKTPKDYREHFNHWLRKKKENPQNFNGAVGPPKRFDKPNSTDNIPIG